MQNQISKIQFFLSFLSFSETADDVVFLGMKVSREEVGFEVDFFGTAMYSTVGRFSRH